MVPWTYLSRALLLRIMDEVPEVIGVKQSAGDLKLFADLMADVKPGKMIYSAVDALMYPSYALGAHGSIAAILSAAPRPSVDLWEAVKAGDHARAHALQPAGTHGVEVGTTVGWRRFSRKGSPLRGDPYIVEL